MSTEISTMRIMSVVLDDMSTSAPIIFNGDVRESVMKASKLYVASVSMDVLIEVIDVSTQSFPDGSMLVRAIVSRPGYQNKMITFEANEVNNCL